MRWSVTLPITLAALVTTLAAILSGTACDQSVGHPPVARIKATPRAIPEHDSFMTDVALDGSASADPIDDPSGTRPLRFSWAITGDDSRVQSGSLGAAKATIRLLGDRPATVTLTATDEDDQSSTATEQLQLTIVTP